MADRQMADRQMTSKIHQEFMKWLTFLVAMKAVKTKLLFNIIFVFDLDCIEFYFHFAIHLNLRLKFIVVGFENGLVP